jgi:SAM-dependent methyltransferase
MISNATETVWPATPAGDDHSGPNVRTAKRLDVIRTSRRGTIAMQIATAAEAYEQKETDYFGLSRTEIAPLLPPRAGRVLELGCGSGGTMAWLRTVRSVDHAVGIELVPAMAKAALAAFDTMITGSIDEPGQVERFGPFDLILALDVLEHIVAPADMVRKYAKLLAVGGRFIVSVPNVGHYSVSLPLFVRGSWDYADAGILDRTHLTFFDEREARNLFAASGLQIEHTLCTTSFPWFGRMSLFRRSKLLRWYATRLLNAVLPRHLGTYQFVICAAKR